MDTGTEILDQKRVASATVRGYEFQILRAAQVWLELGDGETLVCEGDEDLDLILRDGRRVHEQDKHYAGVLRLGSRAVTDSLLAFARTWVARHDGSASSRFRFVTTADRPKGIDEAAWRGEVRSRFPALARERDAGLADELEQKPGAWDAFCADIEWCFGEASLELQRRKLEEAMARRAPLLPARLLAAHLVAHLLAATGEADVRLRRRTRADLESLLRIQENALRAWAGDAGLALVERFELAGLLEDGLRPLPEGSQLPSHVLVAGARCVDFDRGIRKEEWAVLQDLLASDEPVLVRLFLGPGGAGKTRLAVEAVQEARQRGWLGGFLRGHPDDDSWRRLRVGRTPRLVVLDYAETRDRDLRRLLELADAIRKDGGPVLRVILLAREYSEWWTSLAERGESLFQSLIGDCARAYYLAPIELDSGARTALFAAASSQLGALLGDSSHTAPPPLDDTAFARPLYVIAAAFASCLGQRLLDGGALLEWILTHEALFWSKGLGAQGLEKRSADEWSRVGQGSCGPLALSLAAVTLLGGAQSQDDADAIVVAVSPDLPSEARDRVRRALADLYPIGEAYSAIAALEPDLLGERLVSHALARDPGLLQRLRAILLAEEQRIQRCLEVLGRIAIRDPSAEGWIQAVLELDVRRCALPAVRAARGLGLSSSESVIGDGLASVLESSAANAPDSAFLRSLEFELPEYSTVLLRVSGWVAERLLELPSEADGYAERARRLVSFAVRAAHLGEREAAKQAAEEAVLLYRKLAQRNPGAFEPDLAISLSNLGHTLSEIGERKRAKRATQEAVSIFRDLAKRSPRTSESALASTLVNLGSILGELGEREAAKDAAAEAVSLYRDLTQRSPGAFVPGLARSLSSLSKMCRDLGEHEVAETHANEAVSLYRELAHRDPGAFEPGLANALNSMAAGLCEVDAYETARGVIEEAIRILLALTHRIPLAFEPELAMSLNNLSGILSGLGERDAAKEIAEKVVRIRRKLVQRNPGAFRPALASALASLGKMQSELGEHETARESASEAVLLYLELEHGDPGAFTPRLATALNNLGNVLGDLGDREGAKEAAEAAVGILRGLARRNPAAFEPVLATALSNLAVKRGNLYDYERAKEASEEAVRIVRAYAQEDSESHRPALANALHGLGIRLSSLGERETSKAVTEEAVLHFRMLAQRNPGAFKPALASALNNLGNRLSELGELEGAKRAAEEAVGIYRELAQRNPGAFEPLLARALLSLGLILQSDKALEDAARVFREGLRTVLPSLPRFSKALAPLAAALRDAYLRSAAAGDLSLDQGLLNAIDRLIGRPSDEPGSESP